MTTTTTIRRNKDGQQNLTDLRRELAASKSMIHHQGGNWIAQQWSEAHGAFIETPMHPSCGERQAIQKCLFGNYETAEEAAIHDTRWPLITIPRNRKPETSK